MFLYSASFKTQSFTCWNIINTQASTNRKTWNTGCLSTNDFSSNFFPSTILPRALFAIISKWPDPGTLQEEKKLETSFLFRIKHVDCSLFRSTLQPSQKGLVSLPPQA